MTALPVERQVCSLDLAKRLKELGVKQESYFIWFEFPTLTPTVERIETKVSASRSEYVIAAFTVTELGDLLGRATNDDLTKAYGDIFNVPDTRFITGTGLQACLTRPDLCAKMLIYLIENKLTKV